MSVDKLLEVGTRYDHWTELLETFRLAINIIDNSSHSVDSDHSKRTKLQNCVEMIETQMNRLSGLNTSFIAEWQMRDIFNQKDPRENHEPTSA